MGEKFPSDARSWMDTLAYGQGNGPRGTLQPCQSLCASSLRSMCLSKRANSREHFVRYPASTHPVAGPEPIAFFIPMLEWGSGMRHAHAPCKAARGDELEREPSPDVQKISPPQSPCRSSLRYALLLRLRVREPPPSNMRVFGAKCSYHTSST
ncbi:unnamed protein product [Peniophora sp. CBMAI 1063]|nr:unnamed protein product [Peniophora sp. CBMAI 1063]